MNKPNLFIVGLPKCGSTSLHNYLQQHPEVYMSFEKEPNYFNTDQIKESIDYHNKVIQRFEFKDFNKYMSLFNGNFDKKICGESNVSYIFSENAAKNIYNFNPHAKVIIILREPVNFLYSLHSQYLLRNNEDVKSFNEALGLEKERKKGYNIPKKTLYPSMLFYTDKIQYCYHIKKFYSFFSSDQIKLIIFDDFVKNTKEVFHDILTFLNLSNSTNINLKTYNKNEEVKFQFINKMIIDSRIKQLIYNHIPLNIYFKIVPFVKNLIYTEKTRKPLDIHFKKELMRNYKHNVVEVSNYLNIDLVSKWGYNEI